MYIAVDEEFWKAILGELTPEQNDRLVEWAKRDRGRRYLGDVLEVAEGCIPLRERRGLPTELL